jgi:hypothetical protein
MPGYFRVQRAPREEPQSGDRSRLTMRPRLGEVIRFVLGLAVEQPRRLIVESTTAPPSSRANFRQRGCLHRRTGTRCYCKQCLALSHNFPEFGSDLILLSDRRIVFCCSVSVPRCIQWNHACRTIPDTGPTSLPTQRWTRLRDQWRRFMPGRSLWHLAHEIQIVQPVVHSPMILICAQLLGRCHCSCYIVTDKRTGTILLFRAVTNSVGNKVPRFGITPLLESNLSTRRGRARYCSTALTFVFQFRACGRTDHSGECRGSANLRDVARYALPCADRRCVAGGAVAGGRQRRRAGDRRLGTFTRVRRPGSRRQDCDRGCVRCESTACEIRRSGGVRNVS